MSSQPTNAAARLYDILSEARSSPEGSVRDRWKAVRFADVKDYQRRG